MHLSKASVYSHTTSSNKYKSINSKSANFCFQQSLFQLFSKPWCCASAVPNFGSWGCFGPSHHRSMQTCPWFAPVTPFESHATQSAPWSSPTRGRDLRWVDDGWHVASLAQRPLPHWAKASKPRVRNGAAEGLARCVGPLFFGVLRPRTLPGSKCHFGP